MNRLCLTFSSYLHVVSSQHDTGVLASQSKRHDGFTLHGLGGFIQQYMSEQPYRDRHKVRIPLIHTDKKVQGAQKI